LRTVFQILPTMAETQYWPALVRAIAKYDTRPALALANAIPFANQRENAWRQMLQCLSLDQKIDWLAQISEEQDRAFCALEILYYLPNEVNLRISYLQKIWQIAKAFQKAKLRTQLAHKILRIGIREIDCREMSRPVLGLILETWQIASEQDFAATAQIIATSFPMLIKIADEETVLRLFKILLNCIK